MRWSSLASGVPLVLCITLLYATAATAAPACKGPNKNDPGCPGTEDPPVEEPPAEALPAGAIENATVDWLNQLVVIRGTGLLGASEFRIGGSGPLNISSSSDTEIQLDFDAVLAAEVAQSGNYVLLADGAVVLNLYFESSVVDAAAVGCPCAADWAAEPGARWGALDTSCIEVPGPASNDYAEISGFVLDVSLDPEVYPQFPIGAAFVPGEPADSLCRLVQLNGDASQSELVRFRINEAQQAECATALKASVCSP